MKTILIANGEGFYTGRNRLVEGASGEFQYIFDDVWTFHDAYRHGGATYEDIFWVQYPDEDGVIEYMKTRIRPEARIKQIQERMNQTYKNTKGGFA